MTSTTLLRTGSTALAPPRPLPGSLRRTPGARPAPLPTRPSQRKGDTRPPPPGPSENHSPQATRPERHLALDALRGLAALVVVIHHTLLLAPWGQGGVYPGVLDPILHSPAHILVDGPAAVWMFFVLSGIVVMMPIERWGRREWALYLPRRLLRLYLPAAASVPLALGLWWLTFRDGVLGESSWSAGHHPLDVPTAVTKSLTLLAGTTMLNSPLWSLRWELVFALLFPAFAVVVTSLRRAWPVVVGVCLAMSWWGMGQAFTNVWVGAARYLPLFVAGMVIAQQMPRWAPALARVPRTAWWLAAGTALSATTASAMEGRFLPHLENSGGVGVIGAAALVFVVAAAPLPRRLVDRPSLRWLASRSFAIYLVHEPVVLACSNVMGTTNPLAVAAVAFPVTALGAEAFHRFVERPAQRLSRRVGRASGRS